MTRDAEVVQLLRDLVAIGRAQLDEQRRTRELLEAPAHAKGSTRGRQSKQSAALGRLIPIVANEFGDDVWTVGDLFEHSSADIRAALVGLTSHRLGKLLQCAAGTEVEGMHIERAGDSREGALYVIRVRR